MKSPAGGVQAGLGEAARSPCVPCRVEMWQHPMCPIDRNVFDRMMLHGGARWLLYRDPLVLRTPVRARAHTATLAHEGMQDPLPYHYHTCRLAAQCL